MPSVAINSEAEWLTLREMNIGGSDASALFATWIVDGQSRVYHAYESIPETAIYAGSCSPYSNAYQLFLEKTGKRIPDDLAGVERVVAGQYMEPAIASWAGNKYGMKLRKVRRYHTHPTVEGWGASVDYEVHGPGMEPVELKNVDGIIAKRKWVIEDGEVIQAPLHIVLQLQSYIAARGAEGGWLIACVGGNELVRGYFKRHEPTVERLTEAITAFWENVKTDTPPVRFAELETLADQYRDELGGNDEGFIDMPEADDVALLARRFKRVKEHADFVDQHLSNLKGRIAARIGGASRAHIPGFRVSWPLIEREEKIVPERIQKAMSYRGGLTISELKPKTTKKAKA